MATATERRQIAEKERDEAVKALNGFKKKVYDAVANFDGEYSWGNEMCHTKREFLDALGINQEEYAEERTYTVTIRYSGEDQASNVDPDLLFREAFEDEGAEVFSVKSTLK